MKPQAQTSFDIIRAPIISEKATIAKEKNKIVLQVDRRASKPEIKKAVEAAFNVKAERVNVSNSKGKPKGWGRFRGRRPGVKKAVVTIKEGSTIEVFDIV